MADDAAAPDGELTETSAAEEKSGAAEPESAAEEAGTTSDAEAAEETADAVDDGDEASDDADEEGAEGGDEEPSAPAKRRMSHVRLATIAGLVLVLALGGLAGWSGYRAYDAYKGEKQRQLFLQVGRQGALNLTTIDWEHAEADVQRVLDSATGTFYDDFQNRAAPFVEVVKQAQSKSVGTIAEAGLESATEDEGRVLVAVTVNTSNIGAPQQEPRAWRMRLTVTKVGDDAKVSNVEFVP
ncbi:Mce protein [Mycobacterium barrassiae]|uniref:Mce protein n=1 Tax=Mycobacterium barrassiae TaxID=319709 RepID=UPI002265856D|nr:Mce protein [Mycobacterium barrassiae]MCV7301580.1 Mce protein [Mycobacterium barrassiae]